MDRKFFESIRQGLEQMRINEAKATDAGAVDKMHYCATHVEHAEFGQGTCISEEHAEPAEDGSIAWYTVQFEGKEPMVVNTAEMKILQAENHCHTDKKKKMAEDVADLDELEEAMTKEFEKEFAKQPKGVEVHMHHPKTNRITREKFIGTHTAVAAAKKHISDMQKLGWKVKEKKLIEEVDGVEEAVSDIPTYLRKMRGDKPLTVADVKGPRKDSISSKEGLAKLRNEEAEEKQLDELSQSTKDSYVKKAKTELDIYSRNKNNPGSSIKDREMAANSAAKREKGLAKLRNEETEQVEEAKDHTVPKTEKEKQLAALAEPKDKITHADVMVGRGVKKEEVEEQYAEIVEKFDDFVVDVKESYTFAEYLSAAKHMVSEEEIVLAADKAYRIQDVDFVLEAFTRADIESKVDAHRKAGNKVTMPTFGTKKGEPYAEYTVTDKEGQARKYIHHGKTRKVETLG